MSCHGAATWVVLWHRAQWFVYKDGWHLCHLCHMCHHDTEGGEGGEGGSSCVPRHMS